MKFSGRIGADNLDVWSLFQAIASAAPERIAINYASEEISYRALRDQAAAICHVLQSRGLGRHDRLAVLLPNSPLTVAVYLAVAALGATLVPVNTRLAAREVEELLIEARPSLFVVDRQYQDRAGAAGEVPTLMAEQLAHEVEDPQLAAVEAPYQYVRIEPADPCIIFYTSGSTGRPKGVIRTQQNVCWSVQIAMWMQEYGRDTVLLAPLPLFHISGWETKFLCCLLAGGRAVLMDRFDAGQIPATIERYKVTHLFLVPTMTHDILQLADLAGHDLGSLRYWQSGTAPLPKALREEVVRKLPRLQFRISYGTTEAGIISFLHDPQRFNGAGCVGRPVTSVHVRIVDEDGHDTERGVAGEIWCASPMVTAGLYAGEGGPPGPAANAENWLATGDLGSLDHDGFLFVSGRKKDVIISGGENIVASEVEQVLKAHSGIAEAAVIGVPDARWGESVAAFVVLVAGLVLAKEDIDRHCRAHLAGYKCPRTIEFLEALPKTSIGKVQKGALREFSAKLLGDGDVSRAVGTKPMGTKPG